MASPAPSNDDIGARIRLHRERTGRTQAVVAGLSGISADYLGQIERGRKTPSASVLRSLAAALGVPVGVLLGDGCIPASTSDAMDGDQLALALVTVGAPVPLGELIARIDSAWSVWLSSPQRYSRLLPLLPSLIRDTEATQRSLRYKPGYRRASASASDLYALLRTVTRRIGRTDLSFLVADRCLRAAEDAADPVLLAVARWNIGHTLLMSREYEAAVELVETASARVLSDSGAVPEAVSIAGALQLVAAIAEARTGRIWDSRERLTAAYRYADRSESAGNVGNTMFSSVNVELHRISIELEAGDATEALRAADRLAVSECPSVERRFTFAVDSARAYALRREETGSLLYLLEAERLAAEDLGHDPHVHELVHRLLRSTRSAHRKQAAALAVRRNITT